MIDFNLLRPDPTALRLPFEGLVCGIARRMPPPNGQTFNWIAGAGGDGGVEAYWTTSEGEEIGYQAKYHLRSGDIDWGKIDASVEAALRSHPKIVRYVIAIACDLTDSVPGRGKSGRDHWSDHKAKWEAAASKHRMAVEFQFWGASEIEDLLTRPCCVGLRSYWLGELELHQSWFRGAFERAVARLDERYQPKDHVEVDAEQTFGGLLRDHRLHRLFLGAVTELRAASPYASNNLASEVLDAMQEVRMKCAAIGDINELIPSDPTQPIVPETLRLRAKAIHDAGRRALNLIDSCQERSTPKQGAKASDVRYEYDKAYGSISTILGGVREIEDFMACDAVIADETRFVIATGRAGTGKSHILAAEVDRLAKHGDPAVMLLGAQFSDTEALAQQIPLALGLKATWDHFLDVMNAAAEANGVRGLIAIDAINEGGGQRWRAELAALAHDVGQRPWLALAVSCRTEYAAYLITDSAKECAASLVVEGFTSEKERERAAQVYLDGRGILRPATPWPSPEFTNPLFLRTTANALQQMGASEYPAGLHGTKQVLRFYLDTAARHLGTDRDGSDDLIAPTLRAVRSIAKGMAEQRSDHLPLTTAQRLTANAFGDHVPPTGVSWLDVLHRRGILRYDPPISAENSDPLEMPEDVVRFGFQRFQDHLVAETLHDEVVPSTSAFAEGGALSFMIKRHHGRAWLSYEWRTVFQALWITHAERNGAELIDVLPEDVEGQIADDFVETLLWRSSEAFTDRTRELFNHLVVQYDEYRPADHLGILLRFGLRNHPWNAEFLDSRLRSWSMPERDSFWTVPLSRLGRYNPEHSAAYHLVRWCNGVAITQAKNEVLARALALLGWIFTSTDRTLRDTATKGAIAILLDRPTLLPDFVRRFADANDPYVVERVAAACAGACLRDPDPHHLAQAATAIYDAFFATTVPVHLLTRDYARSVVELAYDHGVLPDGVEIDRCRPPYGATAPAWPISKVAVEARSEECGGQTILWSCTGDFGDFGRYVIKRRVEDFSTVSLVDAPPFPPSDDDGSDRYRLRLDNMQKFGQACLWVANRAFDLGWTKNIFPNDTTIDDNRIRGGRIERVGKKYQWIAFHELLARLADSFWVIDEYRAPVFHRYDNPNDVPYVRDLEITVPLLEGGELLCSPDVSCKVTTIDDVPEEAWSDWVFDNSVPEIRLRDGAQPQPNCDQWRVLYRYSSARTSWPDGVEGVRGITTRQEEFWFQMMVGLSRGQASSISESWKRRKLDFHDWLPDDRTDRGYLYEIGQRDTWDEGRSGPDRGWGDDREAFRQFTVGYHWESHLDAALPEGLSLPLPSPWLVKSLELKADPQRQGTYRNADGRAIIICQMLEGDRLCLIRQSEIDALLMREALEPVWLGIGERSVYPRKESSSDFCRRRWNGFFLPSREKNICSVWVKDDRHSLQ